VACHSQAGSGGGGDLAHNIRNFEVLPSRRDTRLVTGTVHFFATDAGHRRRASICSGGRFPVVKGQTIPPPQPAEGHCGYSGPTVTPDFNPIRTQDIQPTALFGAGWIDRISPRAITHSLLSQSLATAAKEFQLDFGSVPAGRVRVLADGRIGKFGWKAQFATLEEFVAAPAPTSWAWAPR